MSNVRCTWALLLLVGAFCLAGANRASAQAVSGILTGTIVDSSGAGVPGATVNATEASTGAVRTAVSGETGLFRIPALNPGSYVVTVELVKFQDAHCRRHQPVNRGNARPRKTEDRGRRRHRNAPGHIGSDSRSDLGQRSPQDRRRRRPSEHPDEGTRHLRIARGAAGRSGHEPEPRLLVLDVCDGRSASTAHSHRTRTSGSTASTSSTKVGAALRSST